MALVCLLFLASIEIISKMLSGFENLITLKTERLQIKAVPVKGKHLNISFNFKKKKRKKKNLKFQ